MGTSTSWESLRGDPSLVQLRNLSDQVAELACAARVNLARFPTLTDLDWLGRVLQRTSSMFTVIVIGQVSAGKSSFINSLLGRKLLMPSDRPTDGVVSVLLAAQPGESEYAEKVLVTGQVERFATMEEATKFLRQQDTAAEK